MHVALLVLCLAAAAGASGILIHKPTTTAALDPCPSCGRNLIVNPGAENGRGANSDTKVTVPGWNQTGSFTAVLYTWPAGDLSPASPGPPDRGQNYFYGGPDAAKSTGTQLIKVPARGISSGKVHYTLSGWLGGYDGQGDNAALTITFENAIGQALGSGHLGPVTEAQRGGVSELLFRSNSGLVPAGTREVQITLVMTREEGSDNGGLADNLSLQFKLN